MNLLPNLPRLSTVVNMMMNASSDGHMYEYLVNPISLIIILLFTEARLPSLLDLAFGTAPSLIFRGADHICGATLDLAGRMREQNRRGCPVPHFARNHVVPFAQPRTQVTTSREFVNAWCAEKILNLMLFQYMFSSLAFPFLAWGAWWISNCISLSSKCLQIHALTRVRTHALMRMRTHARERP